MKNKTAFQLFGIFGFPLGHTLSPKMQEAAFEAAGLKAFYLPVELESGAFKRALRGIRRFSFEGFNVTVPYKQTVIPFLDGVTPEAAAVGAVNTVFKRGAQWIGANTDVYGFRELLKEAGFRPAQKRVLVLGAGGAARAVVYALAVSGVKKIQLSNRNVKRAKSLVREFAKKFPKIGFETVPDTDGFLKNAVNSADLIVNATSLGLKKGEQALAAGLIPKAGKQKKLFCDLIYHVPQTPFMKAAALKRHKTVGGLGMLLHQGARAFEFWTGQKAPLNVMRKALLKGIEERNLS